MKEALDIIRQSAILQESDVAGLNALQDELLDNFLHTQIFRTRAEMEFSVLQDLRHPTADSKYWQSQREQNVHFHELVMLSYEYRKNIIEVKQLERKLAKEEDDLEQELIRIEIEKKCFVAKNQERVAKDRIREIQEWHDIKSRLKPHLKHGTDDAGRHQLESYSISLGQKAAQIGPGTPAADRTNILGQVFTLQRISNGLDLPVIEERKCLPTA